MLIISTRLRRKDRERRRVGRVCHGASQDSYVHFNCCAEPGRGAHLVTGDLTPVWANWGTHGVIGDGEMDTKPHDKALLVIPYSYSAYTKVYQMPIGGTSTSTLGSWNIECGLYKVLGIGIGDTKNPKPYPDPVPSPSEPLGNGRRSPKLTSSTARVASSEPLLPAEKSSAVSGPVRCQFQAIAGSLIISSG